MPACYQKKNPASTFPAPRYFRVSDNETRKNAKYFFDYWAKLPPEKAECVRVKVYRTWPRIDFRLVNPERKSIAEDFIDGSISFDPKDYRKWFLEHYGSGNWYCQMYDIGGWSEVKVAECFFEAEDLERHRPMVDPHTVVWSDPRNAGYVLYCRQRGIPIPRPKSRAFIEAQEMTLVMSLLAEVRKARAEESRWLAEAHRKMQADVRRNLDQKLDQLLKQNHTVTDLEFVRGCTTILAEGAKRVIELVEAAITRK